MTTNQKILLGVTVLAVGYYLYSKNKKSTVTVVTTTTEGASADTSAGE